MAASECIIVLEPSSGALGRDLTTPFEHMHIVHPRKNVIFHGDPVHPRVSPRVATSNNPDEYFGNASPVPHCAGFRFAI